jgi:hypothetical protein
MDLITRIFKNNVFRFLLLNLVLILLYCYYQPLCEPCLDNVNCPMCISNEQYVLIYLAVILNILNGIYILIRVKKIDVHKNK